MNNYTFRSITLMLCACLSMPLLGMEQRPEKKISGITDNIKLGLFRNNMIGWSIGSFSLVTGTIGAGLVFSAARDTNIGFAQTSTVGLVAMILFKTTGFLWGHAEKFNQKASQLERDAVERIRQLHLDYAIIDESQLDDEAQLLLHRAKQADLLQASQVILEQRNDAAEHQLAEVTH